MRAARQALDAARPSLPVLGPGSSAADSGAVTQVWTAVHNALRALAGTSQLDGQELVRELRQRDWLTLNEAHALIDGFTAAERLKSGDVAEADVTMIRLAHDGLADALDRAASGADARPQMSSAASSATEGTPGSPAATHVPTAGRKSNLLGRVLIGATLVAVLAAGAYWAFGMERVPAELRAGRAAYAAGDVATAANQFTVAAAKYPALAEPHIFLGRIARESGNTRLASEALRRAIDLEPGNALAHREMASYLLLNGQLDLARAFYERAIRINPTDTTALGYMGCTLMRLGNPAVAVRFLQRAGSGPWDACARNAQPLAAPPGSVQ